MFTEAEIKTIETYRDSNTKLAFNHLRKIYTSYTGEEIKGCGCKKAERYSFLTMFYEWYEENN